jgi:hypothetical protein
MIGSIFLLGQPLLLISIVAAWSSLNLSKVIVESPPGGKFGLIWLIVSGEPCTSTACFLRVFLVQLVPFGD